MSDVLDAPFPFLIGIEKFIIEEDQLDIPAEVYRVELDTGYISLKDPKPKIATKEYKILKSRLMKATEGIIRPDPRIQHLD